MVSTLRRQRGPSPQTEQVDPRQVKNAAGGYSFQVDPMTALRRFLILGTEGGSYYAGERELTSQNLDMLTAIMESDASQMAIDEVVAISHHGRAPKNDYAIYAMAVALSSSKAETRDYARDRLFTVVRTGAHLLMFAEFVDGMRGWGRALRGAVAAWYEQMPIDQLAFQVVKYGQRGGWSHRDLICMSHPKTIDPQRNALLRYIVSGDLLAFVDSEATVPNIIMARESLLDVESWSAKGVASVVTTHNLPREALPSEWLSDPTVWEALLYAGGGMPITAMIRNLANMTRIGLLAPNSDAARFIAHEVTDAARLKKGRVHPVALLAALLTYQSGESGYSGRVAPHNMRVRQSLSRSGGIVKTKTWTPVQSVTTALDEAFYLAFGAVEPIGKPMIFGLDISGSMGMGTIAGIPGLTPRIATAALALVTAAVEKQYLMLGFSHRLVELPIHGKMRLDAVIDVMQKLPFGATDASLPMVWATVNKIPSDLFVILTDSETYAGRSHPHQVLAEYRRKMGRPARYANVNMIANAISTAHPDDPLSMEFTGFDTAMPNILSAFGRGEL